MTAKFSQCSWFLFVVFLVACGTITPVSPSTNAPVLETPAVYQTDTSLVSSPTPTLLPFVPLEGLRATYVMDGNLYVQDSGGQPVQLTRAGLDRTPVFSDDGQKIVFYRGPADEKNQVYTIDADGANERKLVTLERLAALEPSYDEFTELYSMEFVPGTHKLLFNTHQLSSLTPKQFPLYIPSKNRDLLVVDTDTGEIERLRPAGETSYVKISPDGERLWVLSGDYLEVISLDGNSLHRLTKYLPVSTDPQTDPTVPADAFITMPDLYWTQDSSKLSLVLPARKSNFGYGGPELRTVWQYSVNGGPGVEIRLDPAPVGDSFSISPDGNWIAYSYYLVDDDNETTDELGVYLGNLRDGTSQLVYAPEQDRVTGLVYTPASIYGWSPDSAHFLFSGPHVPAYLGSLDGEVALFNQVSLWIDNKRYIYGRGQLGEIGKQESFRVLDLPAGLGNNDFGSADFVFLGQ
jgi:Tol biopolymer transport system component